MEKSPPLKNAFAKYTFNTWKKAQEKITPKKKCFKKCPSKTVTIPKKTSEQKPFTKKCFLEKKPTGQMPRRKSPGKIPPTYNAFWKRIPLENAFQQNTPTKISTRKMPPGKKRNFYRKIPLGKMPTRKKTS